MMSLERLNLMENIPFSSRPSAESLEELRTFHHMVQIINRIVQGAESLEMQSDNSVTPHTRSLVFANRMQDHDSQVTDR